jgi:MATE family multidrug resistance protein
MLTERNEIAVQPADVRAVFRLAWPVMVSMLSYTTMSVVDTLYIARLGTDQLAAIGLAMVAVFTSQSFGVGLMAGVRVMSAQFTGAGVPNRAIRATWQGLWVGIGFGLVVATFSALGPGFFRALGATSTVAMHANAFFVIRVLAAPVLFTTLAMSAWFQGRGDTRTPMVATLLSNGLNIILDPIFIFGWGPAPELGVGGAAFATVMSMMAGWTFLAWRIHRPLVSVSAMPSLALLRSLWRFGGPIGLRYVLEVGSYMVFSAMLAHVGAIDLAAHVVVVRIVSVSFLPGHAIGDAAGVLVGQFIGAHARERSREAYRSALRLSVAIMMAWAVVFVALPDALLAIFGVEPEVVALGRYLMYIAAGFQLFDAVVMSAQGSLNGAGDTRFVMVSSVLVAWIVKLPLGWALAIPMGLGAIGAWLGLAAEIVVLAVVCWHRIRGHQWLQHDTADEEDGPVEAEPLTAR